MIFTPSYIMLCTPLHLPGNERVEQVIPVFLMSGIAKVLVGQIVEESLDIQETLKESGPVHPKHIREAIRKMRNKGLLGFSKHRKCKLKRL